jgi:transposase
MSAATIAHLKITLDYVKPSVLRRIEVPFDIRLDRLDLSIQAAMGWTNSHLYEIRVGETEEPNLSAVDAVRLYKELSEVERSFANLKDVIDMRPIYHQTDERVQAHIFVAALAFLLHRAIEKKLKAARLDLSATEALRALRSVRVVDIDLGNGTTKRSVTRGTQRAASVLRALAITDLDPPNPPQPGQTVM